MEGPPLTHEAKPQAIGEEDPLKNAELSFEEEPEEAGKPQKLKKHIPEIN